MTKLHAIAKTIGATLLVVSANAAVAETLSVSSTVEVDNTINFTTAGTLDFGKVRAIVGDDINDCVGIVVAANPATATSTTLAGTAATQCTQAGTALAEIQSVGGTIARPTFNVTGLAPFTPLNLEVPDTSGGPIPMVGALPPGSPGFNLYDFTVYRTSGTPGAVALTAGAGTITADGAGNIDFTLGATLATDIVAGAATPYENASYNGTFDVTVTY